MSLRSLVAVPIGSLTGLRPLIVCWVALALAGPAAAEPPPTVKQARKLTRAPRGSLSVAHTNAGRLQKGVEMALKGRGWTFFSRVEARKTHFGTREMVRMLKRAARLVRRRFPGSVMGIGNVAKEEGGQVGESVSHKSGRDADVGLFATDRRGRRVNLGGFVRFGEDGWDRRRRYRFDAGRNLALARAMVSDPKSHVQWLFVARWLEERLVRQAWEEGLEPTEIARLEELLHQPGDSNAHADHFHVRIYCSVDDRLHGCLERGPIRSWVDLGDKAFDERVERLSGLLRMKQARWRKRGVQALGTLRATGAASALAKVVHDPARAVRKAALRALRLIAAPEVFEPLLAALGTAGDGKWAASIFGVLVSLPTPAAVDLARAALLTPGEALPAAARGPSLERIRRRALGVVGWRGLTTDAHVVARYLESSERKVRVRARRALRWLTNQPIDRARREPEDRVIARWRSFLKRHGRDAWLAWMRQGFAARGVGFARLDWDAVSGLVALIRHPDTDASRNASRVLSHITGWEVDPRARTKRNNQRLWRGWLATYVEHFGALPEHRGERRAPEG